MPLLKMIIENCLKNKGRYLFLYVYTIAIKLLLFILYNLRIHVSLIENESNMNMNFKDLNTLDVSLNYNNAEQNNILQTSVSDIFNLVDIDTKAENDDRELHKKNRYLIIFLM